MRTNNRSAPAPAPYVSQAPERVARRLLISVVGGGAPPKRALRLAEEVGSELARRGVVLVCGGLGGVMEAACRGAKAAGGTTIGILPGNDPHDANPYVDFPVCTGIGHARNVIVVKSGRAVIALDGSYGTLSEIGHALAEGIPVIGLETWDLPLRARSTYRLTTAVSAQEAVELAVAAAQGKTRTNKSKSGPA